MDAQGAIIASKLAGVSQMRRELASIKAQNEALRAELETLKAHFALALLAAHDLDSLPQEGRFVIVDGWNAILGNGVRDNILSFSSSPSQLINMVSDMRNERPDDFFWVIFDGPCESHHENPRMRVSYTGGTGEQRADRLIIDFVRMAKFSDRAWRIDVITRDKRLIKEVQKLKKR